MKLAEWVKNALEITKKDVNRAVFLSNAEADTKVFMHFKGMPDIRKAKWMS